MTQRDDVDHRSVLQDLEKHLEAENSSSSNWLERTSRTPKKDHVSLVFDDRSPGSRQRSLPPPPSMDPNTRKRAQLELEMTKSQRAALNDRMSANDLNYLNSYEEFCKEYGYEPLWTIWTIKCVVSSLRTISTTVGYKVSDKQFPMVKMTLRGIGNCNPAPPNRANPMTARILLKIRNNLNLNDTFEASMWALFTTCFFLLLWKSNVTPEKESEKAYMRHKHIQQTNNGLLITLYWTKTIQAGERYLQFPMLEAEGSLLCPVKALKNMMELVPANANKPAFCHFDGTPISYSTFNSFLKKKIRELGMSDKNWSTHFFRWGGTSYLAACGIPDRQIKILGDWKSDCYKTYIHCPWQDKLNIATKVHEFLITNKY